MFTADVINFVQNALTEIQQFSTITMDTNQQWHWAGQLIFYDLMHHIQCWPSGYCPGIRKNWACSSLYKWHNTTSHRQILQKHPHNTSEYDGTSRSRFRLDTGPQLMLWNLTICSYGSLLHLNKTTPTNDGVVGSRLLFFRIYVSCSAMMKERSL